MSSTADNAVDTRPGPSRDRTHYLYIAVIVAMVAGIVVGAIWPEFGKELKPLGTGFVNLIKMMIAPIIFCTIVLGIGSVRQAAQVGKVGGLALGYFLIMSTVALAIGLVVGNLIHPGAGLHLTADLAAAGQKQVGRGARHHGRLPPRHHPDTLVSAADRRLGAADAARGAARRLRPAGDGPRRRADPARHRAPPAAGLPHPGDDHVGRPDRRVRRDGRRRRRHRPRRAEEPGHAHGRASTSPARSSSSSSSARCSGS